MLKRSLLTHHDVPKFGSNSTATMINRWIRWPCCSPAFFTPASGADTPGIRITPLIPQILLRRRILHHVYRRQYLNTYALPTPYRSPSFDEQGWTLEMRWIVGSSRRSSWISWTTWSKVNQNRAGLGIKSQQPFLSLICLVQRWLGRNERKWNDLQPLGRQADSWLILRRSRAPISHDIHWRWAPNVTHDDTMSVENNLLRVY